MCCIIQLYFAVKRNIMNDIEKIGLLIDTGAIKDELIFHISCNNIIVGTWSIKIIFRNLCIENSLIFLNLFFVVKVSSEFIICPSKSHLVKPRLVFFFQITFTTFSGNCLGI